MSPFPRYFDGRIVSVAVATFFYQCPMHGENLESCSIRRVGARKFAQITSVFSYLSNHWLN